MYVPGHHANPNGTITGEGAREGQPKAYLRVTKFFCCARGWMNCGMVPE